MKVLLPRAFNSEAQPGMSVHCEIFLFFLVHGGYFLSGNLGECLYINDIDNMKTDWFPLSGGFGGPEKGLCLFCELRAELLSCLTRSRLSL